MRFGMSRFFGAMLAAGVSATSASAGVGALDRNLALPPVSAVVPAASVEQMPYHMRRPFLLGLQQELANHGYDPGPFDGRLGHRTREAIRRYQYDARLRIDGIASEELMNHLRFARPPVMARPQAPAPRPGPRPDALVYDVQQGLRARGYYRGPLDGIYGPATREAVMRFQRDFRLPVTGHVDPGLREVILRGPPRPGYVPPPGSPPPVFVPPPGHDPRYPYRRR